MWSEIKDNRMPVAVNHSERRAKIRSLRGVTCPSFWQRQRMMTKRSTLYSSLPWGESIKRTNLCRGFFKEQKQSQEKIPQRTKHSEVHGIKCFLAQCISSGEGLKKKKHKRTQKETHTKNRKFPENKKKVQKKQKKRK